MYIHLHLITLTLSCIPSVNEPRHTPQGYTGYRIQGYRIQGYGDTVKQPCTTVGEPNEPDPLF